MNDITDEDVFRLRRMLGMDCHRSLWGYRNWFAPMTGDDVESMFRLENAGLVFIGIYYHATIAGCRLVGLTATEIKRARDAALAAEPA